MFGDADNVADRDKVRKVGDHRNVAIPGEVCSYLQNEIEVISLMADVRGPQAVPCELPYRIAVQKLPGQGVSEKM